MNQAPLSILFKEEIKVQRTLSLTLSVLITISGILTQYSDSRASNRINTLYPHLAQDLDASRCEISQSYILWALAPHLKWNFCFTRSLPGSNEVIEVKALCKPQDVANARRIILWSCWPFVACSFHDLVTTAHHMTSHQCLNSSRTSNTSYVSNAYWAPCPVLLNYAS